MNEQDNSAMMPVEGEAGPRMVAAKAQVRALQLTDMASMWRFAGCLAESGMLPKSYTDAKDVTSLGSAEERVAKLRSKAVVAIQMGAEVGLTPMQAIQNIAVVNGQPSIWGDAQLALVRQSGLLEKHQEEVKGQGAEMVATVTTQRKGEEPVVRTFSWKDAQAAGLAGKDTYKSYPARMLTYRARAYALRDVFPDVLKGLTHTYEEMIDVTPKDEPQMGATPAITSTRAASINERLKAEATSATVDVQAETAAAEGGNQQNDVTTDAEEPQKEAEKSAAETAVASAQ